MPKHSASRRKFLLEAASRYHRSMPNSPAAELLERRGLYVRGVEPFRLGYVAEPLSGHEMYRGRLAIPYLRDGPTGEFVVSIRFRCCQSGCLCPDHPKYLSLPGDEPWIYNTPELLRDTESIAICEGELDTISASSSGVPAIGIPGVETWQPYFRDLFLGYETVFLLADGDPAGMKFANTVAKALPNSKIVPCAEGQDVNSEMVAHGRQYILRKVRR
jgi:5S rRNA maturation endonuclease (ribonuclease M5)